MDQATATLLGVLFGGLVTAITTGISSWLTDKRAQVQWLRQEEAEGEKFERQRKADIEKWKLEQGRQDDLLLRNKLEEIYSNSAFYCGLKELPTPSHTANVSSSMTSTLIVEHQRRTMEGTPERLKWLALLVAYLPDQPSSEIADLVTRVRGQARFDNVSSGEILQLAAGDERVRFSS